MLLDLNIISIIIFLFIFTVIIVSNELLFKILKLKGEFTRKIPHIIAGLFFITSVSFLNSKEIFVLSIFLAVAAYIAKSTKMFSTIYNINRVSYGTVLYPIAVGLSAILFLPENSGAFYFGILTLALSDSMAALVGKTAPKVYTRFQKSIRGTASFFLTTFILAFLISKEPAFLKIITVSAILTTLEFFLIFGLDNIAIPILAGYLFIFLL